MKHTLLIIFVGLFFNLTAFAQNSLDQEQIENNIYTNNGLGWTLELPNGWTAVDLEEIRANRKSGQSSGEELKELIIFYKDPMNSFYSTAEPFEEDYKGEWLEIYHDSKEIKLENLTIEADKKFSETDSEIIDGIEFHYFTIKFYTYSGELILEQLIYSALINEYDFEAILTYNNSNDKEELLDTLRNSRFMKK